MSRELLAIDRLDKQTPAFRRELVLLSDRQGLDPSYVAAVMRFESGLNPQAQNSSSKCTGLIQFCDTARKMLGVSIDDLMNMSAEEQLPLVERYFGIVQNSKKVRRDSLEDHYMAVFAPDFIGASPASAVYSAPSEAYRLNKGLDRGKDGVISVEDATGKVRPYVTRSYSRPRILVPNVPNGPPPPGPPANQPPVIPGHPNFDPAAASAQRMAPALAAGILGFFAINYLKKKR